MQRDHPVAARGEVGIVGDQHQRRAVPVAQPEEQVDDRAAGGAVEVAGGLIGKDDRRARRGGAGKRHALLFPARKLRWVMTGTVREPDSGEFLKRACIGIGRARKFQRCRDILQRGHRGDEVKGLKDNTEIVTAQAGQLILGLRAEIVIKRADGAAGGAFQPAHQHQQRRLAGAGRADQPDALAPVDIQRDPVEYPDETGIPLQCKRGIGEGQKRRVHAFAPD